MRERTDHSSLSDNRAPKVTLARRRSRQFSEIVSVQQANGKVALRFASGFRLKLPMRVSHIWDQPFFLLDAGSLIVPQGIPAAALRGVCHKEHIIRYECPFYTGDGKVSVRQFATRVGPGHTLKVG